MTRISQTESVLNKLGLERFESGYVAVLKGIGRAKPIETNLAADEKKRLLKAKLMHKRRIASLALTIVNKETKGMSHSPVSRIEEAFPSVRRIKDMSSHEEQKRRNDSALMQAMKLIENQPNAEAFEKIVAKSREKLDKQIASGSSKP